MQNWTEKGGPRFAGRADHREWLWSQAVQLLDFFQPNIINPAGGFFTLDVFGAPLMPKSKHRGVERQLHDTTRLIHCFSIAKLMGRKGADDLIDNGMDYLWNRHRDAENGGYFWGVDDVGPTNPIKQAYGHAFVLLAASSAKVAGHPDADRMLSDVTAIILNRFWDFDANATTEEYTVDWQTTGEYRGQNSNMHLTEALMAAFEATNDQNYLEMAVGIADLIINQHAREQGWRVAEHFNSNWQVDRKYSGDPMFRPAGTTPGHSLEWSRLLIQLWGLRGRRDAWMPRAAAQLFSKAVQTGWNAKTGGFYYTLDWQDAPDRTDRFWWPCAEGIGAAAAIGSQDISGEFETWYRRIWGFVDSHLIDHEKGGWFPELDDSLRPKSNVFVGKPDLYHAFQACLIPLLPSNGSITRGLIGNTANQEA